MQVRSAVVGALVLVSAALAQPPFSPDQIGKPPQLLGIALQPSQARMVYKDGREQVPSVPSAEAAAKYFAGYRPVDLPRDAKLTWVLGEEIRGRFFVYLLVRTGHQGGYEYVWPGLTYSAQVDGKPIPMELVEEIPAVRTFRHPDGWGYDLGWIRSEELVDLRPGTRIAVECPEEYSFVCQCLLVSENVRRLDMSFRAAQQRLRDGQELLARLAEVFPTLAPSVEAARAGLRPVAREAAMLARRVEDAEKRIKAGERVDVEKLLASAPAFCNDLDRAERQICDGLHDGLADVLQRLEARLNRARIDKPADFPGRDACYARDVASTYLAVARRMPSPRNLEALRKQTTYYWRANQFLTRAEKALAKAKKPTARAPATAAPELRPHTRVRVLLNGIWEMSTEGSPEEPPSGGWFAVPVPHGPLHETLGQFIALDHGLPRGQKWAWFRTRFTVPAEMAGGAIFLCFDAVFHLCEAYVNGHFVGRHIGGFDPFEFEVTRYVRPGEQAEVLCFVHDTSYTAVEKSDRPGQHCYTTAGPNYYPTSDLWGAHFLGIWQDVALESRAPIWADEVLVVPSVREHRLTVRTAIKAVKPIQQQADRLRIVIRQDVLDGGRTVLELPEIRVSAREGTRWQEVTQRWPDAKLWGIGGDYGDPRNLYVLRTRVFLAGQRVPLDVRYDRFGFREFWIEDGHFWLNGRRLPLQGGGTWYLQETKQPHGNRWWAIRFLSLDRIMNVNIERWHRQGDVGDDILDVADELGMLAEMESPYWGLDGIPDLLGYADWDDPVWVANVTEYYRHWVCEHFNRPSVVLWSLENESFVAGWSAPALTDRFFAFGQVVKEIDPTRPITFHGSENERRPSRDPRFEIINLHYPADEHIRDWREKWSGRPCIVGEFQLYPPLFGMFGNKPDVAAQNMAELQEYIERRFRYYAEIDLPGALYFTPYMAGLMSTARPEWMGPWGDLLGPPEKSSVVESGFAQGMATLHAYVPIQWPSFSGPGIKCERLRTGVGHDSVINWFDPNRPEATPTPVAETIAHCWRPMPELSPVTAPEVIVTVSRAGKPVAGVPVLAVPAGGQATSLTGAITDPSGTAWLVLSADGDYDITCAGASVRWQAHQLPRKVKPGWEHIPRVAITLD